MLKNFNIIIQNKFWSRILIFFIYIIILSLIFSGFYYNLYKQGTDFENKFNNWFDPIYFSWITMTSTGYGDIYPTSLKGKILVCIQIFIYILSLVCFSILSLEHDILKPNFKKYKNY